MDVAPFLHSSLYSTLPLLLYIEICKPPAWLMSLTLFFYPFYPFCHLLNYLIIYMYVYCLPVFTKVQASEGQEALPGFSRTYASRIA